MKLLTKVTGLLVSCSLSFAVFANTIQDHSFNDFDDPELTGSLNAFTTLLIAGEFETVKQEAEEVQDWLAKSDLDRQQRARVLSNLSIYVARADDLNAALLLNNQAAQLLESLSPFHPDLYHVMMAKGYILTYEDAFTEAEDALRHAQNIAHRNQGVYAREQLPTLRLLTEVQSNIGQRKDADQTQRFLLRVNEQLYGPASEEMIPSLAEVGSYFANRGRGIPSGQARTSSVFLVGRNRSIELAPPEADFAYRTRVFREAEAAFQRSISIIEDKYGPTDLRLVEPLKGLSNTKFFEGYARSHAERPMELMAEIVQQNPGADLGDKARALVDLGDLYIKTDDNRASETYLKAWQLLEGDEFEALRYELFGKPVRLLPDQNFQPTLARYPVSIEPNQQLFVDVSFNVMANGRVRQAVVTDSNIPLREQKTTRTAVQLMKYRPRIADGELMDTEGMSLHQIFTVLRPKPEFKAEVDADVTVP